MNEINDNEILYMRDAESNVFLFKKYEPIIVATAKKYCGLLKNSVIGIDDLIQVGYIAVNRCIRNYKEDENTLFYTYVVHCIQKEIIKTISISNHKYYSVGVYSGFISDVNDFYRFEEDFDSIVFEKSVYNYCLDLSFEFSAVFQLRIAGFTYKEISSLLDIPYKRVDNILQKCKNNLKKYLLV